MNELLRRLAPHLKAQTSTLKDYSEIYSSKIVELLFDL